MKIIFMGTPHYAAIVLQKLIESKHEVVGVVCQPDKPVGRKQILAPPETKEIAKAHNIPVFQFEEIKIQGVEPLKNLNADIMVTAAYGQILSQEILNITKYGCYNVHASILPKYRGSSPIQWALINGEKTTGVTILKTSAGIDNGPILLTKQCEITTADTVSTLMQKLGEIGADLMLDALDLLESDNYVLTPQNEDEMTYYPMLRKEHSNIDFEKTSSEVCGLVRGLEEWPTAVTNLCGNTIKVFAAEPVNYLAEKQYNPGEIVCASNKQGLIVKTVNGFVRLCIIQPQNGKKMKDTDFLNGKKIEVGTKLLKVGFEK